MYNPYLYQKVTAGKFLFLDKKLFKVIWFYYLETGLHPSTADTVEAMRTLIQEKDNHSDSCITVKMSRRMQKVEIYLENEYGRAFVSTDLRHIFRSNVGKEFRVMSRGKGPHKPEVASDIVCIHTLMIYKDLIEYNILSATRRFHCCVVAFSFKAQDWGNFFLDTAWTTRLLVTYNSDSCSKFLFIVFTLIWEKRAVIKFPFYLSVSLVLFWCFKRPPTFISNLKDVTRWLL